PVEGAGQDRRRRLPRRQLGHDDAASEASPTHLDGPRPGGGPAVGLGREGARDDRQGRPRAAREALVRAPDEGAADGDHPGSPRGRPRAVRQAEPRGGLDRAAGERGSAAMDIQLGTQRILALDEREGVEVLRQRAMDKRTQAFGSGLGSLLSRPKPDEIELVTSQRRLEPFWHVAGRATYVYERRRSYTVPASAPEVHEVEIQGATYPVAASGPGARSFTVDATEHC